MANKTYMQMLTPPSRTATCIAAVKESGKALPWPEKDRHQFAHLSGQAMKYVSKKQKLGEYVKTHGLPSCKEYIE